MYKIHIFMQCAPDPYECFQSIFGTIGSGQMWDINKSHIWPCCTVNSDQPSAAGVYACVCLGWLDPPWSTESTTVNRLTYLKSLPTQLSSRTAATAGRLSGKNLRCRRCTSPHSPDASVACPHAAMFIHRVSSHVRCIRHMAKFAPLLTHIYRQ